ncbi:MAG: histidine phosphatase family protein [Acidimicrobiia bacterium]
MTTPESRLPRYVTLIRHAETQANAALQWQGSMNAPMSQRGLDQVDRLRKRVAEWDPTRVVASDLERTMITASVFGDVQPDPQWREFDVGAWEGMRSDEIRVQFPGQLEALMAGEDVVLGGAERLSDFNVRIVDAFDSLVASMDDGEEVVVVSHGGAIWALITHVLGQTGRSASLIPSHNTAVTRVRIDDDGTAQVSVFNDGSHLDVLPTQFGPEGSVVSVFRHGQTEGNVAGRWQGRSDSPLTELGLWQAEKAAQVSPTLDSLFTSPLGRTVATAEILGRPHDVTPTSDAGLIEMSFGSWENMTTAEAAVADPELFDEIYVRGIDAKRGGDGESFGDAGVRMLGAVANIAQSYNDAEIGVVSHGAAIRAYVTELVGLGFADRNRFPIPRNSSMSRVIYDGDRAVLAGYNVAPHLD